MLHHESINRGGVDELIKCYQLEKWWTYRREII